VSTTGAVALTLLVLTLVGFLPTVVLVGARLVAVPLCPLAGAVLCALAAATSIAISGTMLMWLVLWASAAATASVVALMGRPGLVRQMGRDIRREFQPMVVLAGVVLTVAVGWALRTVRVPNIGFDTRSIWLLHARWLGQGHAFELAAVRNHFNVVSHPSYPPLISAVMALSWRVSGSSTDRVAVVTVAALNGCALFVAGWGVVEAARRGAARTHHTVLRQRLLIAIGAVVAALVVMVAGGVLGVFGTNGYADPLWSLTAVAAVLFGLVLQPTTSDLGVVAIAIGVAGLTKVEGAAVAILLVIAVSLRRFLQRDRPGRNRVPLLAMAFGVVSLLVWPVLTKVMGVPTDPSISGPRDGSLHARADATFDAAITHLHVVTLAGIVGLAGFFLLRHLRGRLGMGNDLWAWAVLAGAILVLGGAYVFGPGNIDLWLATSVNRTTIFVALLGWWIVAVWALCGTAGALE
jgi:hypothetical protein